MAAIIEPSHGTKIAFAERPRGPQKFGKTRFAKPRRAGQGWRTPRRGLVSKGAKCRPRKCAGPLRKARSSSDLGICPPPRRGGAEVFRRHGRGRKAVLEPPVMPLRAGGSTPNGLLPASGSPPLRQGLKPVDPPASPQGRPFRHRERHPAQRRRQLRNRPPPSGEDDPPAPPLTGR